MPNTASLFGRWGKNYWSLLGVNRVNAYIGITDLRRQAFI